MVAAPSDVSESLDDIEDVRGKLQELAAEGRVDELIDLVVDLLLRVRKDNTHLALQLKGALRQLYGRRSEKVRGAQLSLLFNQLGKDVPASVPVVNELFAWVQQIHDKLVPGTKLHQATTYAINQRTYFARCFTDGRFEIDNGEAERQIRPLKLGEKNHLFAGSENGAADIAVARTIINTCHRSGTDPLAYLTDVIAKLQRGWPKSRIAELLPDRWNAARSAKVA